MAKNQEAYPVRCHILDDHCRDLTRLRRFAEKHDPRNDEDRESINTLVIELQHLAAHAAEVAQYLTCRVLLPAWGQGNAKEHEQAEQNAKATRQAVRRAMGHTVP